MVVKFIFSEKIVTLMKRTVPANSVPAAAVIRGGLALFEMIGRKEHVDGFSSGHPLWMGFVPGKKAKAQPWYFPLNSKTRVSMRRVEFLEERLNFMISGGTPKAQATLYCLTDVEVRKHGDQRGLDTPVVHAVNYEDSLLEHQKGKPKGYNKKYPYRRP